MEGDAGWNECLSRTYSLIQRHENEENMMCEEGEAGREGG